MKKVYFCKKTTTMENLDQIQKPSEQPVSVGDWLITILLMAIPLVGFIMLFIWAFGGNTPASKANWAKATLVWMLICIALTIVILILFAGVIFGSYLL